MSQDALVPAREQFSNKLEYFLTSLSYAVGLGNIWRFPYLCYRNGGGSFFIPYLLSLLFLGLPFFFFESSLGQLTSKGPIQLWYISPIFKGIGYAMFVMSLYVGIYYNMIVAWSLYFVYASFTTLPEVPWAHCNNTWNTANCVEQGGSLEGFHHRNKSASPSQEYFYHQVLERSDDILDMGSLHGHLVLCLALAWILIFLGLSFGAKSMGKISYFTALFPYVMITALIVQGAQLEGAADGIRHYVYPNFTRLATIDVWADAGTQIFFSLSICMGGVINLASYNSFYNNTIRDSILIVVCNSLTSIYGGFAIFSVIGFMANQIDKPIEEAADQGVGLAFVAYPAALARLPLPPLWSVIFFFMLIILGFGSQMTIVETITANIVDFWPNKLQRLKIYVLAFVCVVLFLCGLPMCTSAGIYILQLMDAYSVPFSALIIGCCEMAAIAWVYGINKYLDNVAKMIGFNLSPRLYWKFIISIFCPIVMLVILTLVLIDLKPMQYDDYIYPPSSTIIGWIMTFSSVIMILIYACYQLFQVWRGDKLLVEILRPKVEFNNGK